MSLREHRRGLLAEIERDLAADKPMAGLLRKLILLGGQVRSRDLREWASKELRGYESVDDLPSYRSVAALIQMDAVTQWAQVKHQRVGISEFPEFAQEHIAERLHLTQGVGEIEALIQSHKDKPVQISLPGARELARIMQSDAGGGVHIDSIYWTVTHSALEGVVDQIRTRLVELMAELRSLTPSNQLTPNSEQAEAAVNIVLRGMNQKVVFNTIHGSDGSTNSIGSQQSETPESVFWTASRRIGAIAVGSATVVGGVIAILQF
jgi:hypothetical protein